MRQLLTAVALVTLFFQCSQDALAVGKLAVDPNTLPREQQKGFWDSDSRLNQKVTLKVRRQTISAIMSVLTKMTGVTLNSGYNSKDWQVRDRKMIIVARDMPLGDLMQSIARTMKFKWSRSESEPYIYRIYMDRRTLLDAEGQAYRAEKKFDELLKKRREALADKMADAADVDPAELEKMRDADPYTYLLAKSGFAGPMAQFLQMVPEAREAFFNRDQAWISGDKLSTEAQSAAASMAQALAKMSPLSHRAGSDDLSSPTQVLRIEFNTDDRNPSDPISRRSYLGSLSMQWKTGNTTYQRSFPLMDPENSMVKGAGLSLLNSMERDPDSPAPESRGFSVTIPAEEVKQIMKESDFGEPVATHTAEEWAIISPVKDTTDGKPKETSHTTAEEWILGIAESTGRNVVSDYLGKSISSTWGYGSNWCLRGDTIEFRDRYWFKKRSLQVPESYVEPWRKHFQKNGTLDIDDLAQIAALTGIQEQYEVNIEGDEVLGNESMRQAVSQQLRHLRFYDCLSKDQRAALSSDEGLSKDSLTPQQLEYASRFPELNNFAKPLKMTVKRSPGRNHYRFTTATQSTERTLFSIWTPKYEPVTRLNSVPVVEPSSPYKPSRIIL